MYFGTHAVAGGTLAQATVTAGVMSGHVDETWLQPEWAVAAIAVTAVASGVSDLDHEHAPLSRQMPVLGSILSLFGHRGFTHTVWFTGLVVGGLAALTVQYALSWLWPVLVALGMISHLWLDAFTKSGLYPFRPISSYHLDWSLPLFGSVESGGNREYGFRVLIGLVFIGVLAGSYGWVEGFDFATKGWLEPWENRLSSRW